MSARGPVIVAFESLNEALPFLNQESGSERADRPQFDHFANSGTQPANRLISSVADLPEVGPVLPQAIALRVWLGRGQANRATALQRSPD